MNASEIIKNIEAEQLKAEAPQFSVGDTVKVYGKIKEGNRERIQVFEGTVIKKQGGSNRTTFTVRKISNGVLGRFYFFRGLHFRTFQGFTPSAPCWGWGRD